MFQNRGGDCMSKERGTAGMKKAAAGAAFSFACRAAYSGSLRTAPLAALVAMEA